MKVTHSGAVPVYTVSGGAGLALPEWHSSKRQLKKQTVSNSANRIELLQDFEFDGHSACIRISEDGNYIMSTGAYKPQIHVHDVRQASLMFERHTESLNQCFVLCSSDYSKSIHLQNDRRLQFHTAAGCHYQTRIPRYGRDVVYDRRSTEALIPAVGLDIDGNGEVFRLNLELGRFMRSYSVNVGADEGIESGRQGSIEVGAVNTAALAEESHGLCSFGTSLGTVEFWDPRARTRVATLESSDGGITALSFSPSGLSLATGSTTGLVRLYDLRRPAPLLTKDQGFGYQIKRLIHVTSASQEKLLLSADQRIIRLFDENTGKNFTSIEPEVELHDVVWYKDSGMLFSANEGRQQHAWFIPALVGLSSTFSHYFYAYLNF
jgi:ribosome biogenesis protein ENP2